MIENKERPKFSEEVEKEIAFINWDSLNVWNW